MNTGAKGYKTTEFWVTMLYSIGALLNQSGVFQFQIPLDTVVQVGTAAAVYVGSRSVVKAVGAFAAAKVQSSVKPSTKSSFNE